MPYISKNRRNDIDPLVKTLSQGLCTKGEVNYAITRIICLLCGPVPNYPILSEARGVLMDVYDEFTRKVMNPYEDRKEAEHGSVHSLGV